MFFKSVDNKNRDILLNEIKEAGFHKSIKKFSYMYELVSVMKNKKELATKAPLAYKFGILFIEVYGIEYNDILFEVRGKVDTIGFQILNKDRIYR